MPSSAQISPQHHTNSAVYESLLENAGTPARRTQRLRRASCCCDSRGGAKHSSRGLVTGCCCSSQQQQVAGACSAWLSGWWGHYGSEPSDGATDTARATPGKHFWIAQHHDACMVLGMAPSRHVCTATLAQALCVHISLLLDGGFSVRWRSALGFYRDSDLCAWHKVADVWLWARLGTVSLVCVTSWLHLPALDSCLRLRRCTAPVWSCHWQCRTSACLTTSSVSRQPCWQFSWAVC